MRCHETSYGVRTRRLTKLILSVISVIKYLIYFSPALCLERLYTIVSK